jgi:hypothetical protein
MSQEGEFKPQEQPRNKYLNYLNPDYTGSSSDTYDNGKDKPKQVLSYTPDPNRHKKLIENKVSEIEKKMFKQNAVEAANLTQDEPNPFSQKENPETIN